MNVLLIGGGGLLGNGIVRAFAEKEQKIVVYSGHSPSSAVSGNHYYVGDVTEYGTITQIIKKHDIDCIIHNAAISSPLLYPDNPYKFCRTNVSGTMTALECARDNDVERFIYISSSGVYGASKEPLVYEDSSLRYADCIYGATKIACEELVRNYGIKQTVSLRIGYIYGPGRTVTCPIRQLVSDIVYTGMAERDHGLDQLQDYIYVDDAADAVMKIVTAEKWPRKEYNIGSGRLESFSPIVDVIREFFPDAVIDLGKGTFGFSFESALNIDHIKEDFGWYPNTGFSDGLKKYISWLKATI